MKDLAHSKILGDSDVDQLASVITNLLEEVVALSERISEMEGDNDPDLAQDRINKIVERVLAPLV